MDIITTLTDYPNQRHTLGLQNNESADFHLRFSGRERSWYYDIKYKDIEINSNKVVLTPNSLRQFKNQLPFGITFYTDGFVEPFKLDDFSSGRITMAILNPEEVKQVEEEVYNR